MRRAQTLVGLAVGCACVLVHAVGQVGADSWGPHTPAYWSPNNQFHLKIDRGDDWRKPPKLTMEKRDGKRMAQLWSISSPQADPPLDAFLADDGSWVVLLDQHGGTGYGTILAFLDSRGRTTRRYSLEQVISEREKLTASLSISSIHWQSGESYVRPADNQFVLITSAGTTNVYSLPDGMQKPLPMSDEKALWESRANTIRPQLWSKKASQRSDAADRLGTLRDAASIPRLRELLSNPDRDHIGVSQNPPLKDGTYAVFPVQQSAGSALMQIMGDEAVPLFERKLKTANAYTQQYWMYLITCGGGPKARAACQRLAFGHNSYLKREAIQALVDDPNIDYARRHPELLNSVNEQIRISVARRISSQAGVADVPLLRRKVWHKDWTVGLWLYRALQRLDPTYAAQIFPRMQSGIREWVAEDRKFEREAKKQAAARPMTTAKLVSEVASARLHTHSQWGREDEPHFKALCRRLIQQRAPGLEEALRQAAVAPCYEIRNTALVGIAALARATAN